MAAPAASVESPSGESAVGGVSGRAGGRGFRGLGGLHRLEFAPALAAVCLCRRRLQPGVLHRGQHGGDVRAVLVTHQSHAAEEHDPDLVVGEEPQRLHGAGDLLEAPAGRVASLQKQPAPQPGNASLQQRFHRMHVPDGDGFAAGEESVQPLVCGGGAGELRVRGFRKARPPGFEPPLVHVAQQLLALGPGHGHGCEPGRLLSGVLGVFLVGGQDIGQGAGAVLQRGEALALRVVVMAGAAKGFGPVEVHAREGEGLAGFARPAEPVAEDLERLGGLARLDRALQARNRCWGAGGAVDQELGAGLGQAGVQDVAFGDGRLHRGPQGLVGDEGVQGVVRSLLQAEPRQQAQAEGWAGRRVGPGQSLGHAVEKGEGLRGDDFHGVFQARSTFPVFWL